MPSRFDRGNFDWTPRGWAENQPTRYDRTIDSDWPRLQARLDEGDLIEARWDVENIPAKLTGDPELKTTAPSLGMALDRLECSLGAPPEDARYPSGPFEAVLREGYVFQLGRERGRFVAVLERPMPPEVFMRAGSTRHYRRHETRKGEGNTVREAIGTLLQSEPRIISCLLLSPLKGRVRSTSNNTPTSKGLKPIGQRRGGQRLRLNKRRRLDPRGRLR